MYHTTDSTIDSELFYLDNQPLDYTNDLHQLVNIKSSETNTLFCYNEPVQLTLKSGIALVIMSNELNSDKYTKLVLTSSILINPEIYFNVLALTPEAEVYLKPLTGGEPHLVEVDKIISAEKYIPEITVEEIYAITLNSHNRPCSFEYQTGDYYTMTAVEQGKLITIIDKEKVVCGVNDVLIYPPHSHITQEVREDTNVGYLTISFKSTPLTKKIIGENIYLSNKEIHLLKEIKQLARAKNKSYYLSLIYNYLEKLLINVSCSDYITETGEKTAMRENYEIELFNEITDFLAENIETHYEVQDLVDTFSVSRSTLQNLFNNHAGMSPKTYINQLRLNLSKKYIKESSLTLTEIADKLNYGSIQYFSRAFKQEFGITPSEYAKSVN